MHAEPKSLGRYIAIAAVAVIPAFFALNAYVETKVAPVASYVAQVYGVHASTQVAEANAQSTQR